MIAITVYKCEHCGKIYRRKWACSQHEPSCYKNPETKSCASCQFRSWQPDEEVGQNCGYWVCLKNIDIQTSLTTKCHEYMEAETYQPDSPEIQSLYRKLELDKARERAIKRHGLNSEIADFDSEIAKNLAKSIDEYIQSIK